MGLCLIKPFLELGHTIVKKIVKFTEMIDLEVCKNKLDQVLKAIIS
jgi:hypothetical protein